MSDAPGSGGASGIPGLGDVFAMFGGSGIYNGIGKSVEQFRRGVNDFLHAVENFNDTMQTLNGVARRMTTLLDDVEEPIRAVMPQVMRSIAAVDTMIDQISGPVEQVAPGISRLAETLGSPVFVTMPNEIATFVETLSDVARRMQPLSQMAETAGGLFGLRPLSALRNAARTPAPPAPAPAPPVPAKTPAPAKKAAAKKTAAKKTAPAKKTAARGSAAKRPG